MRNQPKEVVPKIRVKFPATNPIPTDSELIQLKQWIEDLKQNGITPHSHILLFLQEFQEHVGVNFNKLLNKFAQEHIDTLFQWRSEAKEKAKIMGYDKERAEIEAEKSMRGDLFKHMCSPQKKPPDPDALPYALAIVAQCRKTDPSAYEELHLNGLDNISYYARLFAGNDIYKLDTIQSVLEPEHIIVWFQKNANTLEYEPLFERVKRLFDPMNPEKRDIEQAACLIIRGLVHCTDGPNSTRELGDWYYHFLQALRSHGDCRMIPRFIDPNWREDLDCWKARMAVANNQLSDGDQIANLVEDDEASTVIIRDQRQYLEHRQTSNVEFEPGDYLLRPYQNELVNHANSGRNTIICAPTGSGKTLVAVDIIKKHLERRHMEGKIGRCVMLVPTVPLVDQQSIQFVTYLTNYRDEYRPDLPYWVDGFSGCENSYGGRAYRLLSSEICVMTPQILINMMNSVLRTERLYFSDFSLIIFDECHHCDKGHPYKILMDMLQMQEDKLKECPQIVGLTASLGVGDSGWDIENCRRHMLKLCGHLMADSISTVRHQLDDLRGYVMPPVDLVERVKRPINNRFLDEIERVMVGIERDIEPILKQLVDGGQLKLKMEEVAFPSHDQQSRYQTMAGQLKKHVQRIQDSVTRFRLVRSIDHLAHYFHAILISDLLPNHYAVKYLDAKMDNYKRSGAGNKDDGDKPVDQIELINNELLDAYQQRLRAKLKKLADNEKMKEKEILCRLHHIILEQFKSQPDSRCLIFVATRNCAQKLSEHLSNEQELPMFYQKNNVGFMVSSNQSGSAGGQSNQEQLDMRRDFDTGKIKLLVVTSVAEEGVNIAACNLIIKYNNVGSERTMIQRRGRARQKNSRSILLALDNNVEQAEYINIRKEAMMMACIQNLQETDEMTLKIQIENKRRELKQIREQNEQLIKDKREQLSGRRYNLNCRSCANKICSSVYIRSVTDSLIVVCDHTVWQRSKIDIKDKPTKDQLFTKCARWLCGKCGTQEWGTVVKYSDCYLPQLATGTFTLDREDQRNSFEQEYGEGSRKSWNQIQDLFNIDPISHRNIREMYNALIKAMPTLIQQMDEQEYIANCRFLDKMREKKNERKNKIQVFLEE